MATRPSWPWSSAAKCCSRPCARRSVSWKSTCARPSPPLPAAPDGAPDELAEQSPGGDPPQAGVAPPASWRQLEDRLRGLHYRHDGRSEEHTSELQSLMRISYAVFCLKKKNETNKPHKQTLLQR